MYIIIMESLTASLVVETEQSQARVAGLETEEHINALNSKITSAQKTKSRMDAELKEVGMEYERTKKCGRNFDKLVRELKAKMEFLEMKNMMLIQKQLR